MKYLHEGRIWLDSKRMIAINSGFYNTSFPNPKCMIWFKNYTFTKSSQWVQSFNVKNRATKGMADPLNKYSIPREKWFQGLIHGEEAVL